MLTVSDVPLGGALGEDGGGCHYVFVSLCYSVFNSLMSYVYCLTHDYLHYLCSELRVVPKTLYKSSFLNSASLAMFFLLLVFVSIIPTLG